MMTCRQLEKEKVAAARARFEEWSSSNDYSLPSVSRGAALVPLSVVRAGLAHGPLPPAVLRAGLAPSSPWSIRVSHIQRWTSGPVRTAEAGTGLLRVCCRRSVGDGLTCADRAAELWAVSCGVCGAAWSVAPPTRCDGAM